MTYKVLYCAALDELETKVNEYIKEGWLPLGGLAVTSRDDLDSTFEYGEPQLRSQPEYGYLQAITK